MRIGDDEFDAIGPQASRPAVVRFSALGEAWGFFTERWGVWVIATLIVLACNSAVSPALFNQFRVPRVVGDGGFRLLMHPKGVALQVALAMIVNGFFLGGMFRLACRQVRGREIAVEQLFSVVDVLSNLAIGSLLYGLACSLGFFFFVIPGVIVAGLLMFTIPLIVDAGLTPTDSIALSWSLLRPRWLSAALFHLAAWAVAGLGSCLCGVGIVLTAPLYCLSIACLYRDNYLVKRPDLKAPY